MAEETPRPIRRWVKGLTGWVKSTTANPAWNDKVSAEDEELEQEEVVDDLPVLTPILTKDPEAKDEPLADQADVEKEAN
eukprot:10572431-Karenia_brevis.AAC.1